MASIMPNTIGQITTAHIKHANSRLQSRFRFELSFVHEGYFPIIFQAPQILYKKGFTRCSSIVCNSHGKSQLPKVDQSNGVSGETNAMDIVILSNGPGEVATWVKPTVRALKQYFIEKESNMRISVLLAPCPHASGGEMELVQSFEEVDRCLGPECFMRWLVLGHFGKGWEWRKKGVCIFLGGDQFSAQLVLGRRLHYKTIVYCEDIVRWPGLADVYALPWHALMENVPEWAWRTCRVIGDLSEEVVYESEDRIHLKKSITNVTSLYDLENNSQSELVVGILPGSKDVKLSCGVPYLITVAEHIEKRVEKKVRFVLPLAPTVSLSKLKRYADPCQNNFISRFGWGSGELEMITQNQRSGMVGILVSKNGLHIEIWQVSPPYEIFKQCTLCITTIGANTAELGYLGVPMVVVFPTHLLEVFTIPTGLMGLLAMFFKTHDMARILVNLVRLKRSGFLSWPNRWAQEEIVPEYVSRIEPKDVAMRATELLESPKKLMDMQATLLRVTSELKQKCNTNIPENHEGPAIAISRIVDELLNS